MLVRWEIDIDEAETPDEAARLAFETMQREDTTSTVFDVFADDGTITRVDLHEGRI